MTPLNVFLIGILVIAAAFAIPMIVRNWLKSRGS